MCYVMMYHTFASLFKILDPSMSADPVSCFFVLPAPSLSFNSAEHETAHRPVLVTGEDAAPLGREWRGVTAGGEESKGRIWCAEAERQYRAQRRRYRQTFGGKN